MRTDAQAAGRRVTKTVAIATSGLSVALGLAVAAAHHSAAQFDTSTEIVLEGAVSKYEWKNPHVYMAIETRDRNGEIYIQEIEAGASSVLLPLGLTPDSVAIGDRVAVTAAPNRRGGRNIVLGRELTKADGTVLPLFIASRNVRPPSTARATSLAGTWFAPRPGFFALNAGRSDWQLTAVAEAAAAAFDSTQSVHADCIPVTAPTLMVYPVVKTITIEPDRAVIDVDWMQSRRIVHLDGRSHPTDGERTLHGHSIGHWEADTLVIDTTLYAEHREGLAFGVPSGAGKRTIERLSLSADGRHVDYEITISDPDYLAAPAVHRSQWEYRPDLTPTGLACDLDVAQRYLSGE